MGHQSGQAKTTSSRQTSLLTELNRTDQPDRFTAPKKTCSRAIHRVDHTLTPILTRSEGSRLAFFSRGAPKQTLGGSMVRGLLARYLMDFEQVAAVLKLGSDDVRWLVSTGQLKEIKLCGKPRYDSRDAFRLVDAYKRTQGRGKRHGQ